MSDVYYIRNPTSVEEEEGVAQVHQTDLEIDLFEVLCAIDIVKTKNLVVVRSKPIILILFILFIWYY